MENCIGLDIEVLEFVGLLKTIILIVQILSIIALVIWMMIDVMKTVASSDADSSKLLKMLSKRLMAGAMVLLVPIIVDVALGLVGEDSDLIYATYYNCTDSEDIQVAAESQALVYVEAYRKSGNIADYNTAKNAIDRIEDSFSRNRLSKALESVKNGEDGSINDVIFIGDSVLENYCKAMGIPVYPYSSSSRCFIVNNSSSVTTQITAHLSAINTTMNNKQNINKVFIMVGTDELNEYENEEDINYEDIIVSYLSSIKVGNNNPTYTRWKRSEILVASLPPVNDKASSVSGQNITNTTVYEYNDALATLFFSEKAENDLLDNASLCRYPNYDLSDVLSDNYSLYTTDGVLLDGINGPYILNEAIHRCLK